MLSLKLFTYQKFILDTVFYAIKRISGVIVNSSFISSVHHLKFSS